VESIEAEIEKIAPTLQVFISRVVPSRVRKPDGVWVEPDVLRDVRVFAFAGLGRPEGFLESLREVGAEVVGHRWFRDHHPYTDHDISGVFAAARAVDAEPVTTAKDSVKLENDAPVWVMEVEVVPVEGSWRGLWRLLPEVSG
jgi:tetraacyldisaccharide 4'-kinase